MIKALSLALLVALAPSLAFGQAALRPDQMVPGTPDISMGLQNNKFVIGTTIPWRTEPGSGSPTPLTFTKADNSKIIELTAAPTITATLPASTTGANSDFPNGSGFTIQVGPGILTLNHSGSSLINGKTSLIVGPYQSVGLAAKYPNWYATLSVPQPTSQNGASVLADNMTWAIGGVAPPAVTTCPESAHYFSNVSGIGVSIGASHHNAYDTLICGLVSDSVWQSLDRLFVFATNAATGSASSLALLDLISGTEAVAVGSPVFTPDSGFTGVHVSNTVYINTMFNPTAPAVKYAQEVAHLGVWSVTPPPDAISTAGEGAVIGLMNGDVSFVSSLTLWYDDGKVYAPININAAASSGQQPNANATSAIGSWIANRRGPGQDEIYHDGAAVLPINHIGQVTAALYSGNFYVLATNSNGTAVGAGRQIAAAHIGYGLDPAQIKDPVDATKGLYPRLCAFLTAVHGSC